MVNKNQRRTLPDHTLPRFNLLLENNCVTYGSATLNISDLGFKLSRSIWLSSNSWVELRLVWINLQIGGGRDPEITIYAWLALFMQSPSLCLVSKIFGCFIGFLYEQQQAGRSSSSITSEQASCVRFHSSLMTLYADIVKLQSCFPDFNICWGTKLSPTCAAFSILITEGIIKVQGFCSIFDNIWNVCISCDPRESR